jgi:hypothetical protein
MPSGDRVRVRGADEVARTLKNLADDVGGLDEPARAAGAMLVTTAQSFAPVHTGALRASVTYVAEKTGSVVVSAGPVGTTPYPIVQEYGSPRRGIEGKHYMARAAQTRETNVVNEYETAVNRSVDKVKGA